MTEQQTESDQKEAEAVPTRLLKTGRTLVDEDEVVVAEVNGLAYSDGVLIEIAWRYNKYPGLKNGWNELREAISDACFALDRGDADGAKGHLLYALGERKRSPDTGEERQLREAITTHRSHDRVSGTDILRTAAEQVDSVALARDLMSMASDIDSALGGGDHG
jgi:hypothetical protein